MSASAANPAAPQAVIDLATRLLHIVAGEAPSVGAGLDALAYCYTAIARGHPQLAGLAQSQLICAARVIAAGDGAGLEVLQ